jgi:hypothetical protein
VEDRRRAIIVSPLLATCLFAWASLAAAEPLDRRIPDLFGGVLVTSITPRDVTDAQRPLVADRFHDLSAALAAARSQAPIPSASGAFGFVWDPELDTFVRTVQSFGSGVAERAQTLGRHTGTFSFSYTRVDFDTLEGDPLSSLRSAQPSLSPGFLAKLPIEDQMRARDDILQTRLNLSFGFDLFFFTAAFGVTDSVDVSMALSVNRARMSASADAMILDPNNNGGSFFTVKQKGVVVGGSGDVCGIDFRCAHDQFNDSAFGTGDLFLRTKWHFYDTRFADLATVAVLTLPTGNADDFLGFHDPTFTPSLIASKTFGRVSPHLNLSYAFRSAQDVSQAEWVAGADVRTFDWLTLAADFLGFHDDKRDGINDDVLQSALGFKLNPFGQTVVSGTFQLPLNRDGLRSNLIYSLQVEHTF